MKKLIAGLAIAFLLVVFVACSRAAAPPPTATTYPVPAPPPAMGVPGIKTVPAPTIMVPPVPAPTPAPIYGGIRSSAGATDEVSQADADRMIVRTAQMSLLVDDIPGTIGRITQLAGDHKGYVVSSSTWKENQRLRGTITIRVPAGDFDSVMKSLAGLAVEVTSQSTSSKDVTEEYVDLTAKLQNLQATEQQLLKIMQQATKVEDILNIQRELSNVRGQIEQTKGRMQYLERTSATSLVSVNLEQASLDVKFTADKITVKAGERVRFTSQVAGGSSPYSYDWDFGDGNTGSGAAPTHDYKSLGSYTITLKVTDDRANTDTETRKGYITVVPGWSAGNIASSAWNGLVTFGQVLADVLIWVAVFSPVWIVGGGVGYWWWRRRKKS